jgi:uncharacterized membrane protein YhaH (DUF805 family)
MRRWGRINRASYWLGVAILTLIYGALFYSGGGHASVSEALVAALAVPRLHDIGRSAWWAGGVFIAEIVLAIAAFALLPMQAALTVMGCFVLIAAALLIWLGLVPGEPVANAYGEAPAPGLGIARLIRPPQ